MFHPRNKTQISGHNSKEQNMFYNRFPVIVSTEDLKETVKPMTSYNNNKNTCYCKDPGDIKL